MTGKKATPPDYSKGKWASAFTPRTKGETRYWLLKTEPDVFSFEDLLHSPKKTTSWDGIRNFAARNFLRDGMKKGDRVFIYYSMTEPQAIVGIAEIARESYPDPTVLDPAHPGYDASSDAAAPTWFTVDVRAVERLARPVTLAELKKRKELAGMALLRVGRLSVTPVTAAEWNAILMVASPK